MSWAMFFVVFGMFDYLFDSENTSISFFSWPSNHGQKANIHVDRRPVHVAAEGGDSRGELPSIMC